MTQAEIKNLLQSLTLDEKIRMVHGATLFKTGAVPEKDIPAFTFSDGPMGVRLEYEKDMWFPVAGNDDFCSYLPCNSALASTFNRERAYETGQVLGLEARGRGKDMILAPGINIHRSPLGGRNFEYMSEDPCLTGEIAVPFIQGVQESDLSACVKHYALNNQETNRNRYNPVVSERALWEIYLPAFRLCVEKGHTLGIMGAYNKFKNEFLCHQKELINDILHTEWGFDGICVSDWSAVWDTQKAAVCELDVEMGVSNKFDEYYFAAPLKKAIEDGTVKMEDLDLKILHILNTMNRLHMLDGKRKRGGYNLPSSREKLLRTAEESIILLKNDTNTLPLNPDKIKKLVVIGDNADRTHADGGGSSEIKALYELSPLMGIKMFLGGNCEVEYQPGYYNYVIGNAWIDETSQNAVADFAVYKNNGLRQNKRVNKEEIEALNKKYKQDALNACKDADAVLFVGGLNHDHDVEGRDRSDYNLPYEQDSLIKEILNVRPDAIISLVGGSPVSMENWIDDAKTVLYAYYGGMESGYAFARVLFGEVSPSGKLPTTFPKKLSDSPAHSIGEFPGDTQVAYKEDIYVGYRYFDTFDIEPEFPFGYGLTYADFVYIDLTLEDMQKTDSKNLDNSMINRSDLTPLLHFNFNVVNTSEMDAMEAVQIYISPLEPKIGSLLQRPNKELRAFDKKFIKAGTTCKFSFVLAADAFTYYDETEHCYIAPHGNYEILIGSSSMDIRLQQTITLEKDYKVSRS